MANEPKGTAAKNKDSMTVLPDGSAFCTATVQTKKADPVDTFATDYMKTAGLSDLLSPRVWQAAGRRAFNENTRGLPPSTSATGGGVIGTALGGAADLAVSAVNPGHSVGVGPAVGAALGAAPGLAHGALRFPGQLAGLNRHLGAQR
jgi:hypothetical protein